MALVRPTISNDDVSMQVFLEPECTTSLDINEPGGCVLIRPFLNIPTNECHVVLSLLGKVLPIDDTGNTSSEAVTRCIIPLGKVDSMEFAVQMAESIRKTTITVQKFSWGVSMVRITVNFPGEEEAIVRHAIPPGGLTLIAGSFFEAPYSMTPIKAYKIKPIMITGTALYTIASPGVVAWNKLTTPFHAVSLNYVVKLRIYPSVMDPPGTGIKCTSVLIHAGYVHGGRKPESNNLEAAYRNAHSVKPSVALGGVLGLSIHLLFPPIIKVRHFPFLGKNRELIWVALTSDPALGMMLLFRKIEILSVRVEVHTLPDHAFTRQANGKLYVSGKDVLD